MKIEMVSGEVERFEGEVDEFRSLREIMSPPKLCARIDTDLDGHRSDATQAIVDALSRSTSMPGDTAKQVYQELYLRGLFR